MRFLVVATFMAVAISTSAQQILVVEKVGRGRYLSFAEGDVISLVTKEGHFHVQEIITNVYDSSIVVKGGYKILFSNIECIEKEFRGRKKNGITLMVAGGALVAFTTLNNAFTNQPVLDPLYLAIGGGLATAGGVWFSLGKRRYHIGKQWKLKVLDGFLH